LPNNPFLSDLRKYFLGPRGIRVPWRVLLYVAISLSFSGLLFVLLGRFVSYTSFFPRPTRGVIPPVFLIVTYGVSFLTDLVAALLLSRIERRPFGGYGLPLAGAFGKMFLQGAAVGLIAVTALVLSIWALGGFVFGTVVLTALEMLKYGALWALACLVVALMEQYRYRGYLQYTLASGVGFWPAAVALSIVYSARHLFDNPRQNWSGVLVIFLFGLIFSLALRRTGNLWWPIGFQFAWDFGQTFLYSVTDSGYRIYGSLLNSTMRDSPRWLTGGSVGPEGSVFCLLVVALLALFVAKFYPARIAPDSSAKR
jgi:membrane protease YdiL (CAAX protease family)